MEKYSLVKVVMTMPSERLEIPVWLCNVLTTRLVFCQQHKLRHVRMVMTKASKINAGIFYLPQVKGV